MSEPWLRRRRPRFMIKTEMTRVPIVRSGIKHLKLIPVDRKAGAYARAVEQLRRGEPIGLHSEATISRSFELRESKTGEPLPTPAEVLALREAELADRDHRRELRAARRAGGTR